MASATRGWSPSTLWTSAGSDEGALGLAPSVKECVESGVDSAVPFPLKLAAKEAVGLASDMAVDTGEDEDARELESEEMEESEQN